MEQLAIISHNSFRAIGFHTSRTPSSPYGPDTQGSQLITLVAITECEASRQGMEVVIEVVVRTEVSWRHRIR